MLTGKSMAAKSKLLRMDRVLIFVDDLVALRPSFYSNSFIATIP